MEGKLFISYASEDRAWVRRLAAALRDAGWDVWIDQDGIHGGREWRTEIVRALKASDVFVLVLSPASVQSRNVVKELSLAEDFGRRILPVELAPAEEGSDLKYQLAGLQRVSFVDRPFPAALERLLLALDATETATGTLPVVHAATVPGTSRPPPRARARAGSGLGWGAAVVLLGLAALGAWFTQRVPAPSTVSPTAGAEPPASAPAAAPTTATQAPTPEEPAAPVATSLVRLEIAHEVVDSEPRRRKRAFRVGDQVHCFTETDAAADTSVQHRFQHDGRTVHTSDLDVRGGRYRTWSYVTVREPGAWSVEVLDSAGRTLGREDFKVRK